MLSLLIPLPAGATDFFVFPVKVSLPVHMVAGNSIVKRTFKEKDIVNLALGRPLGTKVDKKTEILAVAGARFPEDLDKGRIIVFDPSQNGLAQITTEVVEPLVIDTESALLPKGKQIHGTMTGQVLETASGLGDPSKNALLPSIGWASGDGKRKDDKGSLKGIVAGRGSCRITENGQTTTFSGLIVKGKVKISGKPIGMYSDGGGSAGCGNGIVEPNLGEECEFNDQTACPGDCDACMCVVCGNARIDPGEICDGNTLGVCSQLSGFCKPDCTGCTVCGDGVITPNEECDPNNDTVCPGFCLFGDCTCGCDINDPNSCPDALCCHTDMRCWAPKTGFPSDDSSSPLVASACSGGGFLASGMCGGVVPPNSFCPDQDANPNTFFSCHACGGKGVYNTCTLGEQSCVLDQIGTVP